jgi:hypothetical protein
MTAGTLISGALGGMAAGVMSGLVANDLGELAKRLIRDDSILSNDDLARVAGVGIAAVIDAVAEANEFPSYKKQLQELAKTAREGWSDIAQIQVFRSPDFDPIRETQLPEMFSTEAQNFAKVKALTPSAWKVIIDWLSRIADVELAENLIDELSGHLYHTFPKALQEALKKDAQEGGKAFAKMQLMLLGKIIAATKELPNQYQEIAQQLEEMKAKLTPALPIFSHNRALIEDKTKDFVGREDVFRKIDDFLNRQPKGYFIIEAEPGIGKSAMMAQFVRQRGCVHHFNEQSTGKNSTPLFLEKIFTQLIEKYQLNYKSLPAEATRDSDFLEKLLDETSRNLGQDKLVIVVDALDEVDLTSQKPNMNVLCLPKHLSSNVYFVMTQRPLKNKPLPFYAEAPQEVFALQAESELNKGDIKQFIQQKLAKSQALQNWIAVRNLRDKEFIDQLAEKSEYNFMYLGYVLPDIETGKYQDLDIKSLPNGLNRYYQQHWRRMGMDADGLPQIKIDTIYVLVKLGEPVSAELIADVVRELKPKVRRILREWEQFLRQEEKDGQTCYSVYHASFRDFLLLQETLEEANVSLEDIEDRITNNLRQGL